MLNPISPGSKVGRSFQYLLLATFGLVALEAGAANYNVSAQTASFDCSSVKPGDTVTLEGGVRGPLVVRNCNGTQANPIVIQNDAQAAEPTTIRRSSGSGGGFVFNCASCTGVTIDGSRKWQGAPNGITYGIKITMTGGGSPSAFLRIGGQSRFVTIRNVEVDGAWPRLADNGIGISVNDHEVKRAANPGLWREGYLIERNYVHNVQGEGLYVGPNYTQGDLPLRNIEIRYNRVEDIGWEGINTKSMWAGDNSIHHNVVIRAGSDGNNLKKPTQYSGINNNAGTVKIYNNWVEKTGQHGIQVWNSDGPKKGEGWGPFSVSIWNNVIVDAGALWKSHMADSYGINVGASAGCEEPVPTIYNNTIVNSRLNAIRLTSSIVAGNVRDNIFAGSGASALSAPASIKVSNNEIGDVARMGFVDAGRRNFRLTQASPGRNRGGSGFPQTDFEGVARPQDGAPDLGAFEGNNGQPDAPAAQPNAPSGLVVE